MPTPPPQTPESRAAALAKAAVSRRVRADRASDGKPAYDNPLHGHFNLGRAYDLASQPDSAIVEFEAYIATRYDGRFDDDQFALAGTHKRLGELYDAKGDRERAISHLSKFVEL